MLSLYQKDVRDQKGLKVSAGGAREAVQSNSENLTIGFFVMKVREPVEYSINPFSFVYMVKMSIFVRLRKTESFVVMQSRKRLLLLCSLTGAAYLTNLH